MTEKLPCGVIISYSGSALLWLRALKVAKEKEERLRMYVKQEREKQRVVSKFA